MALAALPDHPVTTLADYVRDGGLAGLERAAAADPLETIDLIGRAGVRGRGGAGFPTAVKWRGVTGGATDDDDVFVVVNGAEGEPGTFKDRALFASNPYVVLEGALIAAHCVAARRIVVATKASYRDQLAAIRRAVGELAHGGFLDDVAVEIVEGPDLYLFGEETALLEVIEGDEPLPRQIPPYLYGLYTTGPQLGWSAGIDDSPGGPATPSSNPVVVNNAETLAHVALVARHGADWYRSMGTDDSPGPTIATVSGDVDAAVGEIELGRPLLDVITHLSGGTRPGRSIKAVLSGVSNGVVGAPDLDVAVSYEALRAVGGGLGSAGFIVYDDTRNMVDVAYQVSRFLHVQSCGQCNSCKLGTLDVTTLLERLVRGTASTDVVAKLRRALAGVTDASRCYLPTQEQVVIASLLDRFPDDLAERLAGRAGDLDVPLPSLASVDGRLTMTQGPPYRAPDWSMSETPVRFGSD